MNIEWLKNKSKEKFYPITHAKAVLFDSDKTVAEEIVDVEKQVATNLLKPTLETTEKSGVTCTNNGDGTFTIDTGGGTTTTQYIFGLRFDIKYSDFTNKDLKLIGCPNGGTEATYDLELWDEVNQKTYFDFGNGVIIPKGTTITALSFVVRQGQTVSNLVFKPMITTNLNATYDDFVPFTGTTGHLNSDVAEIKSESEILAEIIDRTYQGTDLTVKFASEIANYSDEWAWIKARVTDGNYAGIHVCDYIPITCNNGYVLNAQVAGINTYTGYGDQQVGNHIDFICKELWNDLHVMNKVNYNNGNANSPNPFLASDLNYWLNSMSGTVPNSESDPSVTTEVDYTAGGVLYYLPDKLKNQIITKRILLPSRYTEGSVLTSDNSWTWQSTGKLWIPSEVEVCGATCWGNSGYCIGGFVQYPIFANNMNRVKIRCANKDGRNWWLLSAIADNSTYFAYVANKGYCTNYNANFTLVAAPVCFRI